MVAVLLIASEGAHAAGSLWERYVDLITDPAHWMMEGTIIVVIDILLVGVGLPFLKRWVRRHDEQHHEGHTTDGC